MITFKFDPRSLALFRICIGLSSFVNVLNLICYEQFLWKYGFINIKPNYTWGFFSVYHIVQCEYIIIPALFHVFVSLCLVFGYRTSLAQKLVYVMEHSINVMMFRNGGHDLIGTLLLLALDLPLDNIWSLDKNYKNHVIPILNIVVFLVFQNISTIPMFILCIIFVILLRIKKFQNYIINNLPKNKKKSKIHYQTSIFTYLCFYVLTFGLYTCSVYNHKLKGEYWYRYFTAAHNSLYHPNTKYIGLFLRDNLPIITWKFINIFVLCTEFVAPFLIALPFFWSKIIGIFFIIS